MDTSPRDCEGVAASRDSSQKSVCSVSGSTWSAFFNQLCILSLGAELKPSFAERRIKIVQSVALMTLVLADFLYDSQGFFDVLRWVQLRREYVPDDSFLVDDVGHSPRDESER